MPTTAPQASPHTEAPLSRCSDTIRFAASLAPSDAAGDGSNSIAAGCALIDLTPFAMPGAATYGINAAIATTKIVLVLESGAEMCFR